MASLQLADAQQRYTQPFGPGLRISLRLVRAACG
jgi:two-component system sensor histidine kinase TctE